MWASLQNVKVSSLLKVCLATACLKYMAHPRMIWPSRVRTYARSCCDVLCVRARIFAFSARTGRTQLDEPDLEFAAGSRHVDPRHGITDYGPADAASTAVRTIRCGVVGTPQAIDGLRRWLDRCRQPIPGKKSRLGRLFMPFPGFDTSAGFRSTLIFDSRLGARRRGRCPV